MTVEQFHAYHLHSRTCFSTLLRARNLLQEYVVDAWVVAEQGRLFWQRQHQEELRALEERLTKKHQEELQAAADASDASKLAAGSEVDQKAVIEAAVAAAVAGNNLIGGKHRKNKAAAAAGGAAAGAAVGAAKAKGGKGGNNAGAAAANSTAYVFICDSTMRRTDRVPFQPP